MSTFQPARFGPYDLVDRVGEGGMSEVFKAVQSLPGGVERVLAIKRIRTVYASDPEFVEMFIDEARVSMLLQHPNVVRTIDFGQVDGAWYLAMEWVEGRDLRAVTRRRLERRSPWPVEEAVYVATSALAALDGAHRQTDVNGAHLGLVHRDIKPGNILVSHSGEVKVLDFGIAKAVSNTHQTDVGTRPGSAAYMSPEQADGRPLDARSDLFSVAVVLYELLAGRPLFRRDSREATLEALRSAPVEPLSAQRAGVPPALDEAIARGLERDPARRFPSARAFRAALEGAMPVGALGTAGESLGAAMAGLFAADREADRERFERGRRALASVVASAVAASESTLSSAPTAPAVAPAAAPALVQPAPAPKRRSAAWIAVLVLLGLGALSWWRWPQPTPDAPPEGASAEGVVAPAPVELAVAPSAENLAPPSTEAAPRASPSARPRVAPAARPPEGSATPSTGGDEPPSEPASPAPEAPASPEPAAPAEAAEAVDPSTPGRLTVRVSAGWAVVYLDGRRIARSTPVVEHPVPPGVHEVRVEQPSTGRVYERAVRIEPGEAATVAFDVD